MKDNCDDIRPLLDAWIDGELSNSAERRVARHTQNCPECRQEAESRRGIDAAISADDKAGDPGDAYFATLGDRVSARFDFAEASRHWAQPEEPPRRRRLTFPRAWVPRFAFGIAGAAVATIAGLLVHDLGEHPMLTPLPRVTDTVMEAQKSQAPVQLPDSPTGTQTARRTAAPSVRPTEPQPPPQAVTPSAGLASAESDQAVKSSLDPRREMSRTSTAGAPGQPPAMLSPAHPRVMPMEGLSADHPAPPREPSPAQAAPNLAVQSKRSGTDSPAPDAGKGDTEEARHRSREWEPDAASLPAPQTEDAIGAASASGSTSFPAGLTRGANGPTSAADSTTPDRRALLTFFGALTETGEERATMSTIRAFSAPSHQELHGSISLADSTPVRLRRDETRTPADSISIRPSRDEASTPADSTWLRLRRGEARALADSALTTGTLEDCERALRAYWAMLHRDGRPLLPARTDRARALEADRLRIERLLRCASR